MKKRSMIDVEIPPPQEIDDCGTCFYVAHPLYFLPFFSRPSKSSASVAHRRAVGKDDDDEDDGNDGDDDPDTPYAPPATRPRGFPESRAAMGSGFSRRRDASPLRLQGGRVRVPGRQKRSTPRQKSRYVNAPRSLGRGAPCRRSQVYRVSRAT